MSARETFEVGLQVADKQGEERLKALEEEYLQQLRELEGEVQANAQFRGLVAIHDEITRFGKVRALPPRLVEEPVELRDAQAVHQLKLLQTHYSNEVAILRLADRYVQELAVVRAAAEKHGSSASLRALDEERNRVIDLARLRRALADTKIKPPTSLNVVTNGLTDSSAETDRVRRPLELCRLANEPLQSTLGYNMRATLFEDLSRIKTSKSEGIVKARATAGQINYIPRIILQCQHGEVPTGSRLVIEYYSRSITGHSHHREAVETVLLPRLDRGESYTVEAKGVMLYRSDQVTTVMRSGVTRNFTGSEFYGLILHVVNADDRVLVQRFTPQALEHEVAATPPEK